MALLSLFTSKKASLHQQGKEALDRGDLHEAFEAYSQLAHDGDPEGQCRLAYLYKSGVQDYDKAALWYMRAAEQGHAEAQCKLGFLYRSGRGVSQSDSEGVRWYQKAAAQGNSEAQHNLAVCLSFGEGIAKDTKAAISWEIRAAKSGSKNAAYNLGTTYQLGKEVPLDAVKAIFWLEKAGLDAASDSKTVGRTLDPTGDNHNAGILALYELGQLYHEGKIVQPDPVKAFRYMLKAAELGHPAAQCNVGFMLYKGVGTTRNVKEAVKWLSTSAQQGNDQARTNLGLMPEFLDSLSVKCPECGTSYGAKEEHACR